MCVNKNVSFQNKCNECGIFYSCSTGSNENEHPRVPAGMDELPHKMMSKTSQHTKELNSHFSKEEI